MRRAERINDDGKMAIGVDMKRERDRERESQSLTP